MEILLKRAGTYMAALVCYLLFSEQMFCQQITPVSYPSGSTVNYVRTWNAKAPQTDRSKILPTASIDSFLMNTQYVDGIGRPVQTVAKQQSPLKKDFIVANAYNNLGQEKYKYLPFVSNSVGSTSNTDDGNFKMNPFQQDSAFSKGQYYGETYYYSQENCEASPLERIANSLPAGNSWVGSGVGTSIQYLNNTAVDSVRIWTIGDASASLPGTSTIYAAGTLVKTITTDEQQKQVIEYKDKLGKLILKKVQLASTPGTAHVGWLNTYYIYDALENLRMVLQPRAVELVMSNWVITSSIRDELSFYYSYDDQNRMTIKKVPGAGEVWMVYDKRDRLSMTQDANLRTAGKWMVTIYDDQNRPVKTGLWTNSGDLSYHQSQATGTSNYYYPFNIEPTSGWELLTDKGYDDYLSLPTGAPSGNIDGTNINGTNFF
ncbi:MAG: DUF6443 domain-containing protein, partial [Candidatus Dadabacteria bacterium]